MRLSFNLEYFGDCNKVIDFYESVFENASVRVRTFKEMDMAEALGIAGPGLDMIWQSELCIHYGDSVLCLELSDSLMAAMDKQMDFHHLLYNPVICISHHDEAYVHGLFDKLYEDQGSFESLQHGDDIDSQGIRWQYQKSDNCQISYCLTFDGFCKDVIAFYENVFQVKATEMIRYNDSPYGEKIPASGADKIYSAVIEFRQDNQTYSLKLNDSYESAVKGTDSYDPNALLFYQGRYNPIFTVRDRDTVYLSEAFGRLTDGAKLNRPMTPGADGAPYGSLIDKYGICWNFYSVADERI